MEAYIDDTEEEQEEIITLADMSFSGNTLEEFEKRFTCKLPSIPCTGHEILEAISKIGNAYQLAYNCFARLHIVCSKAEKDYKVKRNELINTKINTIRAAAGKPTKLPSKETIEAMVIAESNELEALVDSFKKWEVIRDWFEMHVKKLGQLLNSAEKISFAVNSAEKIWDRTNR